MIGIRRNSAAALVFVASCLALNASCAGSASPATGGVQLRPTCSVANHTPRGVHLDKDTDAIQGAIDECASYLNGGVVVFDKRVYVTGTLQLKSNVDLHITKGTVLLGSSDAMDYPFIPKEASLLSNNQRVLIYSVDAENVSISGDGIIDGNGASNPAWNGSGKLDGWGYRPLLILLSKTNHISFRQITIQNSANWTVVLNQDSNIMIDSVTVKAGANAKSENLDGIDLVDSKNVEIKNSVIESQDDSIVLKSVLSAKSPNAGVSGVYVHNVNVSSIGANGLKIGTSSAGPVSDITFDHVNILGTQYAAMEVESVDGGLMIPRRVAVTQILDPLY